MKPESYYLANHAITFNLAARIGMLPVDGSVKVVISDAGSKSSKQRGLQWMWCSDVARAGIGGKHEDTKNGVHLVSKWKWAIPILMRDDEFFADIFTAWQDKYGDKPEAMEWFVDKQVSTEKFTTSQMAEYLTDFERHYRPMVNLTDPDLMGLRVEN
ncbi:MAG: hypothetical protein ABUJ92_00265 [Desulfobacterales bacterium]